MPSASWLRANQSAASVAAVAQLGCAHLGAPLGRRRHPERDDADAQQRESRHAPRAGGPCAVGSDVTTPPWEWSRCRARGGARAGARSPGAPATPSAASGSARGHRPRRRSGPGRPRSTTVTGSPGGPSSTRNRASQSSRRTNAASPRCAGAARVDDEHPVTGGGHRPDHEGGDREVREHLDPRRELDHDVEDDRHPHRRVPRGPATTARTPGRSRSARSTLAA